jgi:hypothetical protein
MARPTMKELEEATKEICTLFYEHNIVERYKYNKVYQQLRDISYASFRAGQEDIKQKIQNLV